MLKLDDTSFMATPRKANAKDLYFSSSDSTYVAHSSTANTSTVSNTKTAQYLNFNKSNSNGRYTMNHFVSPKPKKSKTFAYKSYQDYKNRNESQNNTNFVDIDSQNHRNQSKNVHFRPSNENKDNYNYVKLIDNHKNKTNNNNSNNIEDNNHFLKTTLLGSLSDSTVQSIKTATISIKNDSSSSKLITNGILLNLNKIGSNLPLTNITNIKSSSFRHNKNYAKPDLTKYAINSSFLSQSHHLGQSSRTNSITNRNNNNINKSDLSRDYDIKNESKLDELSTPSTTTKQSLNRLVKIASSWNPIKDSNHHSNITNSAYNAKSIERSLISQSKIRKTQMFIKDEHEYVDEESCLSRKLAEINDRMNRIKFNDDLPSDKNLKLSKNKLKQQPIIPVLRRNLDSGSDFSSKNDLTIWNDDTDDFLTNEEHLKNKKARNYIVNNKKVVSKVNQNVSSFNKLTQQISIEI